MLQTVIEWAGIDHSAVAVVAADVASVDRSCSIAAILLDHWAPW